MGIVFLLYVGLIILTVRPAPIDTDGGSATRDSEFVYDFFVQEFTTVIAVQGDERKR
jgi:hypothetical protein